MTDKFEEYGCEFLNESACEEVLEEDGLTYGDVEREHFNEYELEIIWSVNVQIAE